MLSGLVTGIRPLGERAVLLDVDGGHRAALSLARRISARDVIPASGTVGVVGDYRLVSPPERARQPVVHDVEVSFDGEDIPSSGLGRHEIEGCLGGVELEVAFIGFMPGFAYLVGLPAPLAALPRRSVPRPSVPAGSFAVGGGYAGIYPVASPGGWHLLGRTGFRAFDPLQPPFAHLQPGDAVRLHPVHHVEPPPTFVRPPLVGRDVEVLEPGLLALIEDDGRDGVASLGVPRAGSANKLWQSIANAAVGNPQEAAAIETAGGVRLRLHRDALVALVGDAPLLLDGMLLPPRTVAAVGGGQTLTVGTVRRHGRAVLALGGGLVWQGLFASRSCDPVSGLPPGRLRPGDRLDLGPTPARARLRFEFPHAGSPVRLRTVAGPDPADECLVAGTFAVGANSDRTGVRLRRLEESPPRGAPPPPVRSHAVVPGAVQVPPAGDPVILGPDCGPIGGYPVTATVIGADLWRLGTLAAGDEVELVEVDLAEAEGEADRPFNVERLCSGWYPSAFA